MILPVGGNAIFDFCDILAKINFPLGKNWQGLIGFGSVRGTNPGVSMMCSRDTVRRY